MKVNLWFTNVRENFLVLVNCGIIERPRVISPG